MTAWYQVIALISGQNVSKESSPVRFDAILYQNAKMQCKTAEVCNGKLNSEHLWKAIATAARARML